MPNPASTLVDVAAVRVLVVDDSVDAAEVLALMLERKGYAVQVAHCGDEALQQCRRVRQDAVLLDLNLPDMSGANVARVLSDAPHPPLLVAVSGFSADQADFGDTTLFAHRLLKPVDVEALAALLEPLRHAPAH